MPVLQYRIKPSLYRDSIALMQLASTVMARSGVRTATAMMATPANLAALATSGFSVIPAQLGVDDLLLAVEGATEVEVEAALDWAETELSRAPRPANVGSDSASVPLTLAEGLHSAPASNLAIISVPGEYAYAEALKALKAGLNVFLFSSGVTLEDEARLKQFAGARGLLMLGAEAGTAIINGIPLGFANAVRRGGIGAVAASGSGLQELTCLIHNGGGGISQAIGVGGRDLHEEVGAAMMLAGLELLQQDSETQVIVLLSKWPAASVAIRVLNAAARSSKPTIVTFLGADPEPVRAAGLEPAATLEEAARLALLAARRTPPEFLFGKTYHKPPSPCGNGAPSRRFVRGLFSGGTLCSEAIQILTAAVGPVVRPTPAQPCPAAHTCLDLGDEEFTRGRPHPMIDGRLRAERLLQAARDPQTAVILFDVVLGFGASLDPATPLVQAMKQAGIGPLYIGHVCGTQDDPQDLKKQIAMLREAGAVLTSTNAAAARMAAEMVHP